MEWAYAVHGRSGAGPGGIVPLSWECLAAWAVLMMAHPTPWECDTLLAMDAAMCVPESRASSAVKPDVASATAPALAWPEKKRSSA